MYLFPTFLSLSYYSLVCVHKKQKLEYHRTTHFKKNIGLIYLNSFMEYAISKPKQKKNFLQVHITTNLLRILFLFYQPIDKELQTFSEIVAANLSHFEQLHTCNTPLWLRYIIKWPLKKSKFFLKKTQACFPKL